MARRRAITLAYDLACLGATGQILWADVTARSRPASRAQLDRDLACAHQRLEELEAQLRQLSQQRDLLLHEMNHRVGNNLAVLLGILDCERSAAEGELAAETSMRISRFILGLAVVQRMLSMTGWRPLRLTALCRAILESVVSGVKPDVRLRVADSTIEVTSRVADRIAVVLSELALNSLRHCGACNVLEIDVQLRAGEGQVVFEYRDSGPGYPEQVLSQSPSMGGLALISELARQGFEGSLALSNAPGAMATLTFSTSGSARTAASSGAAPNATAWIGVSSEEGSCNGGLQ